MKLANLQEINRAAQALRDGKLVVFPTETVYGLGANAFDADAVGRIFKAKGRPSDNPLIVHLADSDTLSLVAHSVSELAERLFDAFAPGPFTVVLEASSALAPQVSAGLGTVAVRIPAHPVARRLIEQARVPIAAPSANRSGEPSPTTVGMSRRSLGDSIAFYLDGGPCEVGLESTVVAVGSGLVTVLRPGAVTMEQIRQLLPGTPVALAGDERETQRSPGTRHRHYRPRATVLLFDGDPRTVELPGSSGSLVRIGIIRSSVKAWEREVVRSDVAIETRTYSTLDEYARHLYRWFHEFDENSCSLIIAELPPAEGLGTALRDRLMRAAAG